MIHECNRVSSGRKAQVADPSIGLIENMTDGIFDAITPLRMMNHGQFPSCIPISPSDVVEHLPRRAPRKRRAGKSAALGLQMRCVRPMQSYGQFAAARDGEQVGV